MADNDDTEVYFRKVANATRKAFADRALAWDRNQHLTAQNIEKTREAAESTVAGKAKVLSYVAIVEAREKGDSKITSKAS